MELVKILQTFINDITDKDQEWDFPKALFILQMRLGLSPINAPYIDILTNCLNRITILINDEGKDTTKWPIGKDGVPINIGDEVYNKYGELCEVVSLRLGEYFNVRICPEGKIIEAAWSNDLIHRNESTCGDCRYMVKDDDRNLCCGHDKIMTVAACSHSCEKFKFPINEDKDKEETKEYYS